MSDGNSASSPPPPPCIHLTFTSWTECDTRSIFKQNTADLNSKFSFETGYFTKAKEPSLSYYLPVEENR